MSSAENFIQSAEGKENAYNFRGDNSVMFCSPSEQRSKRKEFAPGANSFLFNSTAIYEQIIFFFRVAPLPKGFWCTEKQASKLSFLKIYQ